MLAELLILASVNTVPLPGESPPDVGPLYQPCRERVDSGASGDGGSAYRTGIFDCTFVLSDPPRAIINVAVEFTFRKSQMVPLDEDLAELHKLKDLPETPDGNNWRPSLHLGGDFASYREPRFEGEAEFFVMPRWKDAAAQDRAVLGHDWPEAADTPDVRCETGTQARCRTIVRQDEMLFVVAVFHPRREPLETTQAAIRAYVADW